MEESESNSDDGTVEMSATTGGGSVAGVGLKEAPPPPALPTPEEVAAAFARQDTAQQIAVLRMQVNDLRNMLKQRDTAHTDAYYAALLAIANDDTGEQTPDQLAASAIANHETIVSAMLEKRYREGYAAGSVATSDAVSGYLVDVMAGIMFSSNGSKLVLTPDANVQLKAARSLTKMREVLSS